MPKQQELSRFTGSGKTFFLNRGRARNDTEYLAINALYGQGNRERLVLFPPHFLEFRKHLTEAIETLQGVQFNNSSQSPPTPSIPKKCPSCSHGAADYEIVVHTPTDWDIFCESCGHHILEVRDG